MSFVRIADWFCKTQDIWKFYLNHTNFLCAEIIYPFLSFVAFIHAYRHGGRYVYTWIGIYISQLVYGIALSSDLFPILNNCWFAQGLLTFFGARIPLSTIFGANQVFLYVAYVFVQRMYLPFSAQPIATGLCFILLKLPYLISGTKYLWWTWHEGFDTDPIFGIPWIAYFFELFFSQLFVYVLNIVRSLLLLEIYDWKKFSREFLCVLLASLLSFSLTVPLLSALPFVSEFCQISIGTIFCLLLSFFAIVIYAVDRRNPTLDSRTGNSFWFDELSLVVCVHFLFLIFLSLVVNPSNIVSEGLHQPFSTCKSDGQNLCKFRNSLFDFHCLPGGRIEDSESGLEWYAICGTPFQNRTEFSAVLSVLCFLASLLLYQAAAASGKTPHFYRVVYGRSEKKKKTK
ncbi:hypothetical protein niasHT_027557 [Heterodera trifolii]|uniref:DUF7802 domain-containing protein n=1 Tax=Heterodera trifolii TaxID=157864 RepID=A0ABD2K555_9BILA